MTVTVQGAMQAVAIEVKESTQWVDVCALDDLVPWYGGCALVQGRQVAIFYLNEDGLYAIDNYDPIGKANVLHRGIVGDIDGELVVASPLYKQHFSLITGHCLEKKEAYVETYAVRVVEGRVQVGAD
ncbi:MAG: nitrite reductase small subunit NirD [Gammaproteobacteria bacterium]